MAKMNNEISRMFGSIFLSPEKNKPRNSIAIKVLPSEESVEYKLKRNKISDPGWGINEIFEKIKEEDDSSSSSTYDQIENEIKEIKARKYFLVPKRFERDPSEDPLQASRYVKLLNMLTQK